jgi:5-methylcytosine-specific restriction endonuclease McrA
VNKTQVKKLLVAERKSMREKQKQSAFMRKTLNIYRGMRSRKKEFTGSNLLDFGIDEFRAAVTEAMEKSCCLYCGTKLTVNNFAADHRNPISWSRDFSLSNVDIVCKSCNWQKGGEMHNGEFHGFLAHLRAMRKEVAADIKRRLTIGGKWGVRVG